MPSTKYTNIKTTLDAKKVVAVKNNSRSNTKAIRMRVTSQEEKQIKSNVKKLNTNVSAYARLLTTLPLEIVDETINNPGKNATLLFSHSEIKKLRSNIRTVSDNYNQIARAYNTIEKWEWAKDNEIKKQFARINSELEKIDNALPEINGLLKKNKHTAKGNFIEESK